MGLDGAVADDEVSDSTESEESLPVRFESRATGESVVGAGVSRSFSARDPIEEAELDTLPVELRLDKERNENAAAEEAVDVRLEEGATTGLDRSEEVESGRSNPVGFEGVTLSPSEHRRLGSLIVAKVDGRSEEAALSSSSASSWYMEREDWCGLKDDGRFSSAARLDESKGSGIELRLQLPERVTPPTPPSLARLIDSLLRDDAEYLL